MNTSTAQKLQDALDSKNAIKLSIEAMGVTVGDAPFSDYSEKILSIGDGVQENDVNFYDFDGRRIASYTIAEAKALTALPIPPVHTGLTFQEWNWSLSDIQNYNRRYINVGANYITSDERTHIYIHADAGETYYMRIAINNLSLKVDWGDNNEETFTSGLKTISHTYSNRGNYEVVLYTDISGALSFYELSVNDQVCIHMVDEIRLGKNINIETSYSLRYYTCKISIPTTALTSMSAGNFTCAIMPMVVVPRTCTTMVSSIGFATHIGEISLPKSMAKSGETSYFYNLSAKKLILPECTDSSYGGFGNYFNSSPFIEVVSLPLSFKWNTTNATYGNFTSMNNLRIIDIVQGWVPNINLKIDGTNKLTAETMVDFFTKLGNTSSTITITIGTTNLNKLTTEQKNIATNKGYTLA